MGCSGGGGLDGEVVQEVHLPEAQAGEAYGIRVPTVRLHLPVSFSINKVNEGRSFQ